MEQKIKKIKTIVIVCLVLIVIIGMAVDKLKPIENQENAVTIYNDEVLQKDDESYAGTDEKNVDLNSNTQSNYDESGEPKSASESGKISLNSATKEELMTLQGIGETKAKAIIEYREKYNGFVNIEEIKEVKGIGDVTYNKIKDSICL